MEDFFLNALCLLSEDILDMIGCGAEIFGEGGAAACEPVVWYCRLSVVGSVAMEKPFFKGGWCLVVASRVLPFCLGIIILLSMGYTLFKLMAFLSFSLALGGTGGTISVCSLSLGSDGGR